jgi:crotonobetainyl-CoA:carnitine CoA-transferase CaiB-like acyl-CoA transferase
MLGIFEGLRVLELANVLAGPSVGQFFAELGAQVVKIENPQTNGDVTRSWKLMGEAKEGSISAYFSAVNSGKLSIALDLKDPSHFLVFLDLVQKSDILISSYKPGDAERLNIDYNALKELNPKLIYGAITGYGSNNPKVGYDAILQAESGFMFMNGEPGGNSIKMPVALIDVLAAHQLKEALLLAYIHQLKTGVGSKVSVSLLDTAIVSLVNQATNYLIAKHDPVKMGSEHPNIAPYGSIFHCKDGEQIVLAIGTDKQFQTLCNIIRMPELANQVDFKKNANRVNNRSLLNDKLQKAFSKLIFTVIINQLNEHKIPAGKLRSVAEVFDSRNADHLVLQSDLKAVGLRNFVGESEFLHKLPHISPPPAFNQHFQFVLRHILQYSDLQISRFF